MATLSSKERRSLLTEVRRLIGKNYTDEEIMDKLNVQPHVLSDIKAEILSRASSMFHNLTSEAVYEDFLSKCRVNIKEIDEVRVKFKNRGQWSSLIAAQKVKHEIYKDVVKLGQDLGFIDKKSGELKLTGEMSFSSMSDSEVVADIQKEIESINKMVGRKSVAPRPEVLEAAGSEIKQLSSKRGQALEPEVLDAEDERPRKKKKVLAKVKLSLKKRV